MKLRFGDVAKMCKWVSTLIIVILNVKREWLQQISIRMFLWLMKSKGAKEEEMVEMNNKTNYQTLKSKNGRAKLKKGRNTWK